jgi:hypothetical protein
MQPWKQVSIWTIPAEAFVPVPPAMSLYGRDLKAVTRLLMMRRICWI